MIFSGETALELAPMSWLGIIGLAVVSSVYGYIARTVAQKNVTPERVGFLYALEPVFCCILAFLFFGEILSLREVIGAIMILLCVM